MPSRRFFATVAAGALLAVALRPASVHAQATGLRGQLVDLVDRILKGASPGGTMPADVAAPGALIIDDVAPFVFSAPSGNGATGTAFDSWASARAQAPGGPGTLVREGDPAKVQSDGLHFYALVPIRRDPPAGSSAAPEHLDAAVTYVRQGQGIAVTTFTVLPQNGAAAAPAGVDAAAGIASASMLAPVRELCAALEADVPANAAAEGRIAATFVSQPLVSIDFPPFAFSGPTAISEAVSSVERGEAMLSLTKVHFNLGNSEFLKSSGDVASFVLPTRVSVNISGESHSVSTLWRFVVQKGAGGAYKIVAAVWSRSSLQ